MDRLRTTIPYYRLVLHVRDLAVPGRTSRPSTIRACGTCASACNSSATPEPTPPPAHALAKRGIVGNLRGYSVFR